MSEAPIHVMPHWLEPEWVFVVLSAENPDIFWLDSASSDGGVSYIGTGNRVSAETVAVAPAGGPSITSLMAGGWVGWLDYERGAERLGLPTNRGQEDSRWLSADDVVTFVHSTGEVFVRGSAAFVAEIEKLTMDSAALTEIAPLSPHTVASERVTAQEHGALVAACRESIAAGDAYQLCLTTRFTVPGTHDDVDTYRRLRAAAPSHHGGFIRIGGESLISISPEQFLTVSGESVGTKPIKGTRRRGHDAAEDEALKTELAVDVKERAENVMIVDLMRNDLSRVCVPGTIDVPALWEVETYSTVHQLVSVVRGDLRPGVTVGEVWDAAFPAGSMTGAPKLSAMTILQSLEAGPRGIYAGCFGWVGEHGGMDLAMVIRSIVITPEETYVGAGGGITWGSDPAFEVAEVGIKARAPLAALGARIPDGW